MTSLSEPIKQFIQSNPKEALKIVRKTLAEKSLAHFMKQGWKYIDPAPYLTGWHIDAIAEHLTAVNRGQIKKLLVNMPPRHCKSSLLSVAWPAWTWLHDNESPLMGPQVQWLYASYAHSLSLRDSLKTRRLIESPWYQENWGRKFALAGDQNTKHRFDNDKGGYRIATSVGGSVTGEGGSVLVVDDPLGALDSNSEAARSECLMWWDESMSTRLSIKEGAFVIVMQRLHEEDLSGHVLKQEGYEHLMLPARFDSTRVCVTSLGFEDPRTDDGEPLWPERFDDAALKQLETSLGPTAAAGQLQQMPQPRGGGVIKREWWQLWEDAQFPPMEYIVASLDPAYTEDKENDYNGFVVLGVYRDKNDLPRIMLMTAWEKRLTLHGPPQPQVKEADRTKWGVVEWVAHSCRRFKVDKLLIENKASGKSVQQEIKRLYQNETWSTQLVEPKGDKVARMYRVEPLFAEGMVYSPDREWADLTIDRVAQFPKGSSDDIPDALSQGLGWLRDSGWALRREERALDLSRERAPQGGGMGAIYEL